MADDVLVSASDYEQLVAVEQIQEVIGTPQASIQELYLLRALREFVGAEGGEQLNRVSAASSLTDRDLARALVQAVQAKAHSNIPAEVGEENVWGTIKEDGTHDLRPADLGPVGPASVYGKILLELARRLEQSADREEMQREREVKAWN